MKKKTFIMLCALFMLSGQTLIAQQSMQVLVGHQRTLSVPRGAQVNIGDPSIATARATPDQQGIIITGQSKGMTTLTIVRGDTEQVYHIEVLQRDPNAVVQEIETAFGQIEGVRFQVVGSKIFAKGAVYTLVDLDKLDTVCFTYKEIIDLVENRTEKRMISVAISIIEVSDIRRVDFNKNPAPDMFLGTTPESGVPFLPSPDWSSWVYGITIDQLLDRLAYWVTKGEARIVANPTLTVTDGDTARFISGGEFPYQYSAGLGMVAVEWKEYGIVIKVRPEILGSGNLMLDLEAEVSAIDLRYRIQDIPATTKRKTKNVSVVKFGETVALAGLYHSSLEKSVRRVPVLGHLLPFLFASVEEIEERKEIIILVTPNAPPELRESDYPTLQGIRK